MPKTWTLAAAIAAAALSAGLAQAETLTDQTLPTPPGFFNGNGQPNNHFVTNNSGEALIGLGVINRYVGSVAPDSPDSSNYTVQAGFYSGAAGNCQGSCSNWNIQFSLALAGQTLNQIESQSLTISDTLGHSITIDPLHDLYDDAGFNPNDASINTAYSPGIDLSPFGGPVIPAVDNTGVDSIYQNSQNITFFPFATAGFDPLASTTYTVVFSYKFAHDDNYSVSETINAVGASTPLPAALPLFASGLGALGLLARRKRKAAKA